VSGSSKFISRRESSSLFGFLRNEGATIQHPSRLDMQETWMSPALHLGISSGSAARSGDSMSANSELGCFLVVV
jgi:hypothetical protein